MNNKRAFFSSVIPSVLAFALSGIYAIVDGFFIGNSIGDIGLSTINIAYPVVALMQAIGTGIGMGGAVIYSISIAAGDNEEAELYAKATGSFLLIASVVVTAVMYIALKPVLGLLGAEGQILVLGERYLRIIVLGAVFQVFSTGIVPLIRNYHGAAFAMASMTAGFLTNIVLDYVFVWILEWGVSGAAAATIIGQGVTMTVGLIYLLARRLPVLGFHIPKASSIFKRIVKVGLAPFGLTLTPNLAVILMNRSTISYGG
ncbi:MAG: polysaccharide biosynthesis C-terminal domain-containing protein [Acetatifactor sp.]|nr:polysaccharide biosynthesis C-terminal domain-containing protein [Acetatifactor sp.]